MRTIRITGSLTPEKALTAFAEALDEDDASTATRDGYVQDVRGFFAWYSAVEGQHSPVVGIRSVDLGSYRNHLLDVERRKGTTVNRKLQALKRFYRFALDAGWRQDDPTRKTKSVRIAKRLRPIALSKKEETSLLRAASQSPRGLGTRNYALVQLMLQAGLRVGEVARLKNDDVTLHPRSGEVIVRDGKGHRQRIVPLNAAVRRGLNRYLEAREHCGQDTPLFVSERGGQLSLRSIQHTVSTAAKRAGVAHTVGAHTLRHTFAARFIEDHPDQIVALSTLLGHESLNTTAIYIRPSSDDLARRLERA